MSASSSRSPEVGETPSLVNIGARIEEKFFTIKVDNFDSVRKSNDLIMKQRFEFEAGASIGLPTKWECYLSQCDNIGAGAVGTGAAAGTGPEAKKKWIGTFFKLSSKPVDVKEVNISFTFRIKRANGSLFFVATAPVQNMANSAYWDWGFPTMFQQDAKIEDLPLVNGALTIEADFRLLANKPANLNLGLSARVKEFESKAIENLSRDLGATDVLTGANSDSATMIISKDGMEFPVNRGVLSARSKVFEHMFRAGMTEANSGEVRIDDLSSDTMNVLLRYIVTGKLHEDWNSAVVIEELIYAAHKYELGLLKEFLDDILGVVCNMQNVKSLAILANKLGMKKAEKELFEYIKSNATTLEELTITLESPPPKRPRRVNRTE